MPINNSLNLSEAGIITHDGKGDFLGRKIIGTNGISVKNQDGIAGDLQLSVEHATTTTAGVVQLADEEMIKQGDPNSSSHVLSVACLKSLPTMPYLWVYFKVEGEKITLLNGYNMRGKSLYKQGGNYFITLKGLPKSEINMPVFCNAWSVEKPTITWRCFTTVVEKEISSSVSRKDPSIQISIFLNGSLYTGPCPVTIQVVSYR